MSKSALDFREANDFARNHVQIIHANKQKSFIYNKNEGVFSSVSFHLKVVYTSKNVFQAPCILFHSVELYLALRTMKMNPESY